jgi:hypothetical protein
VWSIGVQQLCRNVSRILARIKAGHLAGRKTDAWLATLDSPSAPVSHDDALAALDAARGEPATQHG